MSEICAGKGTVTSACEDNALSDLGDGKDTETRKKNLGYEIDWLSRSENINIRNGYADIPDCELSWFRA